ncbi:unnamed protein product [Aphanomyces euteiches]
MKSTFSVVNNVLNAMFLHLNLKMVIKDALISHHRLPISEKTKDLTEMCRYRIALFALPIMHETTARTAYLRDPHIRGTYMEHTSNIPSPTEALYDGAQDDSDTDNTPHARNYDNDETDESQDQGLTLEQLRLHDQQSRAYRQEPYNERDSYFGGRNISR